VISQGRDQRCPDQESLAGSGPDVRPSLGHCRGPQEDLQEAEARPRIPALPVLLRKMITHLLKIFGKIKKTMKTQFKYFIEISIKFLKFR